MFAQRLRKVRRHLDLTQKEIAQTLKIPFTAISKYERGEVKPCYDILARIGQSFNVNLNWMIVGEGSMFKSSVHGNLEMMDMEGYPEEMLAMRNRIADLQKQVEHYTYLIELQKKMLEKQAKPEVEEAK